MRTPILAILGMLLLGLFLAIACVPPKQVRSSTVPVPMEGIQRSRIVHLSDVHLGWTTSEDLLEQALDQTRQADPDLVVLTGDYLNRGLRFLPQLKSFVARLPRPCIAVMGNHDHWAGVDQIQAVLLSEGVQVLRNAHTTVRVGEQELTVVGVDDSSSDHDDVALAFRGVENPDQALVLTHSPGIADRIAKEGGRLILAGHTHGGQIDIPKVTEPLANAMGLKYMAGWYRIGQSWLFVNSGLGSAVIQSRVGARAQPEVAIIDLGE